MLTIGILSDTHGTIHPNIINLINNCDFAIHAGDIVDESILQKLTPKQKIIAVQGNNDHHITFLKEVESLDLPGGKIIIEHGHKHGHINPATAHSEKHTQMPRLLFMGTRINKQSTIVKYLGLSTPERQAQFATRAVQGV
jgi:putative phosphoesterase